MYYILGTLVGWLVQTIMRQPFPKAIQTIQPFPKAMYNQLKNTVYNIIVTIVDMVEVSIARLMCLIQVEVIIVLNYFLHYLALKSDT